jgi:hypothetical protein
MSNVPLKKGDPPPLVGSQEHCKQDPIYVFPEMKLRGLIPKFHIHVSGNDFIYSQDRSAYFAEFSVYSVFAVWVLGIKESDYKRIANQNLFLF